MNRPSLPGTLGFGPDMRIGSFWRKADLRTSTYMGAHAEYNLDPPVGLLVCIAPDATSLRKVGEVTGVMLDVGGVFTV